LVDEFCLHLVPKVLGGGLRLFTDHFPPSSWRQQGVVVTPVSAILTYRRQ